MPEARCEGDCGRLDKWLAKVSGISRSEIKRLIEEGKVTVDGVYVTRPSQKLREGQLVRWSEPTPKLTAALPADIPLNIVYQDSFIAVINKPAGLVVHPAAGHERDTLVNGLVGMGLLKGEEGNIRPGIVHRIDKDTSGLIVVALAPEATDGLIPQFASHSIEREYVAVVAGSPPDSGTFRTLHGRHPTNRLKFSGNVRNGKEAVTHYCVLERFGSIASLVSARLETGRTHQIRVHFSEAGYPLIGDGLYKTGGLRKEVSELWNLIQRQALHARVLGFVHPVSGENLRFEAPLPDDMVTLLDSLRKLTN